MLLVELDSVVLLVACANKVFEQKDKSKTNAARGRLRIFKNLLQYYVNRCKRMQLIDENNYSFLYMKNKKYIIKII
jgi:hypothetical protein